MPRNWGKLDHGEPLKSVSTKQLEYYKQKKSPVQTESWKSLCNSEYNEASKIPQETWGKNLQGHVDSTRSPTNQSKSRQQDGMWCLEKIQEAQSFISVCLSFHYCSSVQNLGNIQGVRITMSGQILLWERATAVGDYQTTILHWKQKGLHAFDRPL